MQLETRVKELEMANEEMEARLQRLQSTKVCVSDLEELTSDDSSHAVPFDKAGFRGLFPFKAASSTIPTTTGTTTTGYSSSLPSSPSRMKEESSNHVRNSLTGSPTCSTATHLSSVQLSPPDNKEKYSRIAGPSHGVSSHEMSPKVSIYRLEDYSTRNTEKYS